MSFNDGNQRLVGLIGDLFSGFENRLGDEFILGRADIAKIVGDASQLIEQLGDLPQSGPVTLASSDKSLVASAFLASAAGGPSLVIPYSLSDRVIEEAAGGGGSKVILSAAEIEVPDGCTNHVFKSEGRAPLSLEMKVDPQEAIVSIFTGGSTGTPKQWKKSALNLLGEAIFLAEQFEITAEDILIATVPAQHIYGLLFSVLLPLAAGARTVAEPPYYPNEIIEAINETKASVLISSPMHYKTLAGIDFQTPGLKKAFSSGGFLDTEHNAGFVKQSGAKVYEVYGSTETGGIAGICRTDGEKSWRPFGVIDWKIVDERLAVQSPFISLEIPTEDGYFITGDRVEPTEDGNFNLLGRADNIVKIAGKRVDIAEVEAAIKKVNNVDDAFVFRIPAQPGRENEIGALYVGGADPEQIRQSASSMLEPFALPKRIKKVEAIPVSAAGKREVKKSLELLLN